MSSSLLASAIQRSRSGQAHCRRLEQSFAASGFGRQDKRIASSRCLSGYSRGGGNNHEWRDQGGPTRFPNPRGDNRPRQSPGGRGRGGGRGRLAHEVRGLLKDNRQSAPGRGPPLHGGRGGRGGRGDFGQRQQQQGGRGGYRPAGQFAPRSPPQGRGRGFGAPDSFRQPDAPRQSKYGEAESEILLKLRENMERAQNQRQNAPPSTSQSEKQPETTSESLDIFRIPIPPKTNESTASPSASEPSKTGMGSFSSPDATPHEIYLEFYEAWSDPEQNRKFRRLNTNKPVSEEHAEPALEFLRNPDIVVPIEMPALDAIKSGDLVKDGEAQFDRRAVFEQGKTQKAKFVEQMNFDEDQFDIITQALNRMANLCSKSNKADPVLILWQKAKETGCTDKNLLRQLLYLAGTLTVTKNRSKQAFYDRYVGKSTGSGSAILDMLDGGLAKLEDEAKAEAIPEDSEEEIEVERLLDEIGQYNDLLYDLNEQTVQMRMRLLVAQGKAVEAHTFLKKIDPSISLHLRVFTPVLRLHLGQKNTSDALALYHHMKTIPSVHFDSDTYVQLLSGLAEYGCFQRDAPPIEGATTELEYSHGSGPGLFDELVFDMSEDIIEISSTNARRLHNALAKGMPDDSGLRMIGPLESLRLENEMATSADRVIASRVQIDHRTGVCPRTGIQLRLKTLTGQQKVRLIKGCTKLAVEQEKNWKHQSSHSSAKSKDMKADENLKKFLEWLDNRHGKPFTAIVDGANVGYYMQNFQDGRFSIHQIKLVVDALEQMGENPLVILPHKYSRDFFHISLSDGKKQRQGYTPAEQRILHEELMNKGKVYIVPPSLLDDYYWILGSVASQTVSSKGEDLTVPSEDPNRWPGARPLLISNDQMRDHKLGMLEPMGFRRWYSNFIVNYNFAAFVAGRSSFPEVGFSAADFYSREIQSNKGDQRENVWHFPLESEHSEEWFSVCLDASSGET